MPITMQERPSSQGLGHDDSVTIHYLLTGSTDAAAVRAFVLANAPSSWGGRVREQYPQVEPVENTIDETTGMGWWEAQVKYTPSGFSPIVKKTGDSTFQFEIGGQDAIHVTQALLRVGNYGFGVAGTTYNTHGAINCVRDSNGEHHAQGVDIPGHAWPRLPLTKTCYMAASALTTTYIAALYGLAGRVNSAEVTIKVAGQNWIFAAGELIWYGCRGCQRGGGDWELTFQWEASPNVTDACVDWPTRPDNNTGTAVAVPKKGWEYLWVLYASNPTNGLYLPKPLCVYVDKVIPTADLTALGTAVLGS